MSRRGFTLVEMLIAIAVLAILATLFFGGLNSVVEHTRRETTEIRVHTLGCKAAEVQLVKGFPPSVLEDLAPMLERPDWLSGGKFVDDWNRPLQYTVTGKQFRVWSCGADGVSGTADDIRYKNR